MENDRYFEAVEQLASILNLSEEALAVAEGWSILPESIRRHFKLLLDDYIAAQHPTLQALYANARHADQLRYNRIIQRIQAQRQGLGPKA